MNRPAPLSWGLCALVALGSVLLGVLYLEFRGPSGEAVAPGQAGGVMAQPGGRGGAPSAAADPVANQVNTILARPLFDPRRRPDAPAGERPPDDGLPRLTGIVTGPFGKAAIFSGPSGGRPVVVSEGRRIGPYLMLSIQANEAVVQGPEGRRVLHPAFDRKASPNPPRPVAARPGGAQPPLSRPPALGNAQPPLRNPPALSPGRGVPSSAAVASEAAQ